MNALFSSIRHILSGLDSEIDRAIQCEKERLDKNHDVVAFMKLEDEDASGYFSWLMTGSVNGYLSAESKLDSVISLMGVEWFRKRMKLVSWIDFLTMSRVSDARLKIISDEKKYPTTWNIIQELGCTSREYEDSEKLREIVFHLNNMIRHKQLFE